MPRCVQCGKVNREAALYCQECGTRLPEAAPSLSSTQPGSGRVASGPAAAGEVNATCPTCGASNPAGMNFCRMCGARVAAPRAGGPAAAPERIRCAACGQENPARFAYCQRCGTHLGERATGAAGGRAMGGLVTPTPPAGLRPPAAHITANFAPQPAVAQQAGAESAPVRVLGGPRLLVIRPDGAPGASWPLDGETLDIGRTQGALRFENDPYLAPRHARVEREAGGFRLSALDHTNGVFVRIRERIELGDGDRILIGRQLLELERIPLGDREPRPAVELGVRVLGSRVGPAWGRLLRLGAGALICEVYALAARRVVLGRAAGDIRFGDDELCETQHAALMLTDDDRIELDDLESRTGTFVRLRSPHRLQPGDLLRVGEQLLRFET